MQTADKTTKMIIYLFFVILFNRYTIKMKFGDLNKKSLCGIHQRTRGYQTGAFIQAGL